MYMPSWWLFNVALYVARFAAGCVGRQFVVIFVDSQEDYDRLKVKLQEKK